MDGAKPPIPVQDGSLLAEGPWQHQFASAAGKRFHLCVAGTGAHDVLLLHDFPLYWWTWREIIPALTTPDTRVIAMDLRGFGASDFQPGEVSLRDLSADVTFLLRTLASESVTIVGAGMGGTIAWEQARTAAPMLKSVVTVSCPYPMTKTRASSRTARSNYLMRAPWEKTRALQNGSLVKSALTEWAAPGNRARMGRLAATYAAPMKRHFAAQAAWETFHATRALTLTQKKKFEESDIRVPILSIRGELDPHTPRMSFTDDARHLTHGVTQVEIPQAGHYLTEEAPTQLADALKKHLRAQIA